MIVLCPVSPSCWWTQPRPRAYHYRRSLSRDHNDVSRARMQISMTSVSLGCASDALPIVDGHLSRNRPDRCASRLWQTLRHQRCSTEEPSGIAFTRTANTAKHQAAGGTDDKIGSSRGHQRTCPRMHILQRNPEVSLINTDWCWKGRYSCRLISSPCYPSLGLPLSRPCRALQGEQQPLFSRHSRQARLSM